MERTTPIPPGVIPEEVFETTELPYTHDPQGEPYFLLGDEVRQPVPFNRERPGNGIMIHVMCLDEDEERTYQVQKQMKETGFLTPRRYASLSSANMLSPGLSDSGERIFVYRGHKRWSREYLKPGEIEYREWAESLIGVPVDEARAISDMAFQRQIKTRNHRNLGWRVWSYIPPEQLIGIISWDEEGEWRRYFDRNQELTEAYKHGRVSEAAVSDFLWEAWRHKDIEGRHGLLSDRAKREFWQSIGGSFTEAVLLEAIIEHRYQRVEKLITQFHWTKAIQKHALEMVDY